MTTPEFQALQEMHSPEIINEVYSPEHMKLIVPWVAEVSKGQGKVYFHGSQRDFNRFDTGEQADRGYHFSNEDIQTTSQHATDPMLSPVVQPGFIARLLGAQYKEVHGYLYAVKLKMKKTLTIDFDSIDWRDVSMVGETSKRYVFSHWDHNLHIQESVSVAQAYRNLIKTFPKTNKEYWQPAIEAMENVKTSSRWETKTIYDKFGFPRGIYWKAFEAEGYDSWIYPNEWEEPKGDSSIAVLKPNQITILDKLVLDIERSRY